MIEARDSTSIYAVPLNYHAQGLDAEVLDHFGIMPTPPRRIYRAGSVIGEIGLSTRTARSPSPSSASTWC